MWLSLQVPSLALRPSPNSVLSHPYRLFECCTCHLTVQSFFFPDSAVLLVLCFWGFLQILRISLGKRCLLCPEGI